MSPSRFRSNSPIAVVVRRCARRQALKLFDHRSNQHVCLFRLPLAVKLLLCVLLQLLEPDLFGATVVNIPMHTMLSTRTCVVNDHLSLKGFLLQFPLFTSTVCSNRH
jgi:hypothetical protein